MMKQRTITVSDLSRLDLTKYSNTSLNGECSLDELMGVIASGTYSIKLFSL